MAEQDIEQAAKAQLSDKQIADVMEEFPIVASWGRAGINTFASKVQYAMQPHLARESGRLNALSSEEVDYLADIWRARNTTASLQSQLYDLFEELVERRHPHMRSVPVASDVPASAHYVSEVRPNPGNEDACCTICGALLVCMSCGNHQAEALKRQGYVPASALGPLTDEEWLDLCAGDRVSAETLWRSDIDLFLKRRLAPEHPKTPEERVTVRRVPGSGVGVFDGYDQRGPNFLTHEDANRYRAGLIAELKAEKEAANAVSDQS
jgi:hypothetical protein